MSKVESVIFFVLILLIPSQLSYHYWPLVEVVRVDYHALTIFSSDLLVAALLLLMLLKSIRSGQSIVFPKVTPQVAILGVLIAANIALSQSPVLSSYKYIQLIAFGIVSFHYLQNKNGREIFFTAFPISLLWVGVFGIYQVILNRSVGGLSWWIGERPLSIVAHGVSTINWSWFGVHTLRPYSVFPHPNALAGYLLIGLLLLCRIDEPFGVQRIELINKIKPLVILVSTIVIALTFSINSLVVGIAILIIGWKSSKTKLISRNLTVMISLGCLLLAVAGHSVLRPESFTARTELLKISVDTIVRYPFLGTGFGGYLYGQTDLPVISGGFFQPVHNGYLLLIAELGIPLFIFSVLIIVDRLHQKTTVYWPAIYSLILLNLFDHYWITSHANLFLLVIIFCLSYISHTNHDSGHHAQFN